MCTRSLRWPCLGLLSTLVPMLTAPVASAQLRPGDILVYDSGEIRAVRGTTRVPGFEVNAGNGVVGLASGPNGDVYFTQRAGFSGDATVLQRLDPLTGTAAPVPVAAGSDSIYGLAIERGGTLVGSTLGAGIVRIDPTTGVQTPLAPAGTFLAPAAFVQVGPDGSIYATATDLAGPYIARIDPTSGAVSRVTSDQFLVSPKGIAVAPDGTIYAANISNFAAPPGEDVGQILRIDPATGQQSVVYHSASNPGELFNVYGIAVEPGGTLLLADQQLPTERDADGAIFRLDPSTGQRTLVYRGSALENNPQLVAVFVPEPGTAGACGLAAAATATALRRRRSR